MTNPYKDMDYRDYLTTQHWEDTRKRKLSLVGGRCEKCPRSAPLEVHHLTYERLGEERMEDLQTLCRICHCREHGRVPTSADWDRVRFVFGWETVQAHKTILAERIAKHKASRDVNFYRVERKELV